MKLAIGENIRSFRKKNDLTQETLAERLGVSYQSISRWENGATYPDLEMLPAIAEALAVTIDELLGMPDRRKEEQAEKAFDALRRECMKGDYDRQVIIDLIRDIRRNYMASDLISRPFCEGNHRAFSDPMILPEVRLLAEDYLARYPMSCSVIKTMAEVEDEAHLEAFLEKYTTSYDCSARELLYWRYYRKGDVKRFDEERRYKLSRSVDNLLNTQNLVCWNASPEDKQAADIFAEKMLQLIRCDAKDDGPDMWVQDRIETSLQSAKRMMAAGKEDEAVAKVEEVVKLLEKTMLITDEILLDTSCRFLRGMEWYAREEYGSRHNDPDDAEERFIFIETRMEGMCVCYCIYPHNYLDVLKTSDFAPLQTNPAFEALCARVSALITTK